MGQVVKFGGKGAENMKELTKKQRKNMKRNYLMEEEIKKAGDKKCLFRWYEEENKMYVAYDVKAGVYCITKYGVYIPHKVLATYSKLEKYLRENTLPF